MAAQDIKISELDEAIYATLDKEDIMYLADTGISKNISIGTLFKYFGGINDYITEETNDPNLLWDKGVYEITNEFVSNLPTGASTDLVLTVRHYRDNVTNPQKVMQVLEDRTTGAINSRSANDYESPVWSAWVEGPLSARTYDFVRKGIPDTGNPIIVESATYVDIASLVVTRPEDVYEISFSATFNYGSTSRSAKFQWSIDGGITWEEFSIEPKDSTDTITSEWRFPTEYGGGEIDLRFQAACELAGDILTIRYANIIFERKTRSYNGA